MLKLQIIDAMENIAEKETSLILSSYLRELPGRRTVRAGRWNCVPIVAKCYHKHEKQERDVQREWKNLKKLKKLGLQIPVPLFLGKTANEDTVIVLRRIENGFSLADKLQQLYIPATRKPLFEQLLALTASLHDAGCFQRDNHLDNYLYDDETLYALDASSIKISPTPLGLEARVKDLALLFVNVDIIWEEELWNLLDTYLCATRRQNLNTVQFKRLLRSEVPLARKRRVESIYKKTRRDCSAFGRKESSGQLLLFNKQGPQDLIELFHSEPEQFIKTGTPLKKGNTCTVTEFTWKEKAYVIKRYNEKSLFYRLSHFGRTSRAINSWSNGNTFRFLGLSTPLPIACLEERNGLLLNRAYLLNEKSESIPLDQYLKTHTDHPARIKHLQENFLALWKALDSLHATHGDLKANNLLVSENGVISLIDLDAFRFFRHPILFRQKREKDRKRFMKNWESNPDLNKHFECLATVGK